LIKNSFVLNFFVIYGNLVFVSSNFPSELFYSVTQISIAIRINAVIFVEVFSSVLEYLIQKYIILWLVKPNKTYNEFAKKKYRIANKLFFAEGVKGIQSYYLLLY
jgi:hypothetical protein